MSDIEAELRLDDSSEFQEESRTLWNDAIEDYLSSKQTVVKTQKEADDILDVLKRHQNGEKFSRDQRNNYFLIGRYTYKEKKSGDFVLKNMKDQKIPIKEKLFDLLYNVHHAIGHGGRDLMYKTNVLSKYEGITKDLIGVFLRCCKSCELKKSKVKRGLVVKPILSEDFNSRCQLDLIDLQSKPDGEFKFIFVYQDHFTKFIILRPLKTKTAESVAYHLRQIFADFGPPQILQTDNGKEFANTTIEKLVNEFGGKLVHGKPRHSQSQGSVERANRDIQDILTILMQRRKSSSWTNLLPEVQLMKNARFHRGINQSPYEALFGRKYTFKMENIELDEEDEVSEARNEQLDVVQEVAEKSNDNGNKEINREHEHEDDDKKEGEDDNGETYEKGNQNEDDEKEDHNEKRRRALKKNREVAKNGLKRQAKAMLEKSNKRFKSLTIGETVRMPVADVDRGKTDHRNVMGVVMSKEDDFYVIGTEQGILKNKYARNQLELVNQPFLRITDVPQKTINSLRSVANANSTTSGQRHVHCQCRTGCATNRCKCRSIGRLCNSRCHDSQNCKNKNE